MSAAWRIFVDSERCQGHARCLAEASDLLDSDELGYAVVLADGELDGEQQARARKAAAQCPEQAIVIVSAAENPAPCDASRQPTS